MEVKGENIIFLFGAGASVDAGIPISNHMVKEIENYIEDQENKKWNKYKDLYYYLKSSINYSDGILGKFNEQFNVERLLIVITEIEKRETNIMYPFIGTWNNRLLDLGGLNFNNIKEFHKLIRKQLNSWVGLRTYDEAKYFESFISLSTEVANLIKVFTLNYDLCFENIVGKEKNIELGFTKETNVWHQSNFENIEEKHYNLYKLHGSVDWYIDDATLKKSEKIEDNPELIFGVQHKMTSIDPYFYYSSVLRNSCMNDSKIIVTIGYSFADDYVNVIISQALNQRSELRLINVAPLFGDDVNDAKKQITQQLKLKDDSQIIYIDQTAKIFMTSTMNKDFFEGHIAEPDGVPFE